MTTSGARPLEVAIFKQIKVELVERGLDQKDLAGLIGLHPVTMSKYLSGKTPMPARTFIDIAEALGLSSPELMTRAAARIPQ